MLVPLYDGEVTDGDSRKALEAMLSVTMEADGARCEERDIEDQGEGQCVCVAYRGRTAVVACVRHPSITVLNVGSLHQDDGRFRDGVRRLVAKVRGWKTLDV